MKKFLRTNIVHDSFATGAWCDLCNKGIYQNDVMLSCPKGRIKKHENGKKKWIVVFGGNKFMKKQRKEV